MSARRDPAQRLAGYLARTLNYDEERQKVMAYGLGALFQMLLLLGVQSGFRNNRALCMGSNDPFGEWVFCAAPPAACTAAPIWVAYASV